MSPTSDRDSYIELLDEVMSWLTGLGLITFVIFPLALPLIALTALLAIPLLLAAVPLAILAAPMLLIRRLLRARRREDSGYSPPAVNRSSNSSSRRMTSSRRSVTAGPNSRRAFE
jgi:hypothetical protein